MIVIGLHHHPVEYPRTAPALSVRIGTTLINGSWFVRRLRPLVGRVVLMHGHPHIDWVGECAGLVIVAAPSPVMDATVGSASPRINSPPGLAPSPPKTTGGYCRQGRSPRLGRALAGLFPSRS
jgi:hypothetical protein